jgi:2-oxoisovalerate dehydrogenase E1 component
MTGFNPIVNYLAKVHYRWGQAANVVIRMPSGAGVGAGPFHSQSNESWFFHTPGLKVVMPSSPYDAKGLLAASIEDPNPVIFFEHKALYRSISGEVPDDYYTIPIGKAALLREGDEMTIIAYGSSVHWAANYLDEHQELQADLIDLRTLLPLDLDCIVESVKKTGKVLIVHEDTMTGGIGAEIAARVSEDCFEYLDGPVTRVASMDSPVPFAAALEKQFLPNGRLLEAIQKLQAY